MITKKRKRELAAHLADWIIGRWSWDGPTSYLREGKYEEEHKFLAQCVKAGAKSIREFGRGEGGGK